MTSKTVQMEGESLAFVLTPEHYLYCEDCETFVDLFKYRSVEDTGHDACRWRYVTKVEFEKCAADCARDGCFSIPSAAPSSRWLRWSQ